MNEIWIDWPLFNESLRNKIFRWWKKKEKKHNSTPLDFYGATS